MNSVASGGLPDTYQQVEYIESSGTQYIKTGILPSSKLNFEIKYYTNSEVARDRFGCIFGSRVGSGTIDYEFSSFDTQGTLRWRTHSTSNNIKMQKQTVQEASFMDYVFTNANGETTIIEEKELYLFGLNNNGSFQQGGSGCRIYYLRFYEDGTKINDFVPCYRIADNEIGMYDTVTNIFYTNAGTGTFTKGNDV